MIIPWNLGALAFNKPSPKGIIDEASVDAVERKMVELREAFNHLPLGDVLRHVVGEDLAVFQEQLANASSDDPCWQPLQC